MAVSVEGLWACEKTVFVHGFSRSSVSVREAMVVAWWGTELSPSLTSGTDSDTLGTGLE